MPQKNIYIRDADKPLWDEAEELAGTASFSQLITDLLRDHVEQQKRRKEALSMKTETIDIEVEDKNGHIRKKRFEGRWLVNEFESDQPNVDYGTDYSAAFTKRGSIAVMVGRRGDVAVNYFDVFDSFDDLARSEYPEDFISAVGAELDEDYVEELDI